VSLVRYEIPQRRGDDLSVSKLGDAVIPSGIRHRRARVERQHHRKIRRLAKLSRVEPVAPGEQLPVEMLEIVADAIGPVLTKLCPVAMKRAPVAAGTQPFDDDSRSELQVFNRRDDGWRERRHTLCHPERSEGSAVTSCELQIPRCARDDCVMASSTRATS